MRVLGTAGHVDHGKSSLVKALTGIDPDRLREEKQRQMTIDLGFAWLRAAGGEDAIGIVDVPGHRDFIENMLAGIGGVDLALLVVAADEGVMPQTREHLAILELLEVRTGVVALNKIDLAQEAEWLDLVTEELRQTLRDTRLAGAPLLPVSARTGQGLAELEGAIWAAAARTPARPDAGRPKLPIDRVFTLPGFGVIATGTLSGGRLAAGQNVEIQPSGRVARLRGLQVHGEKVESAGPGTRLALSLVGVEKSELGRGDVLAAPGVVTPTRLADVSYQHRPEASAPLRHNDEVKVFSGTAELLARVRLLGRRQLEPGEKGWLQLAFSRPLALAAGERFILRRPSPPATIGGGTVLDPAPGRRHARFRPNTIARMESLTAGGIEGWLLAMAERLQPAPAEELIGRSGQPPAAAEAALNKLLGDGHLVKLGALWLTAGRHADLERRIETALGDYHRRLPLRRGMPREELRSRLKLTSDLFQALIDDALGRGRVTQAGPLLALAGHRVELDGAQIQAAEAAQARLAAASAVPPPAKEIRAELGDELFLALLDAGRLRQINPDVVYEAAGYSNLKAQIVGHLRQHGRLNAAQLRDLLATSRKFAIAWLEHLDAEHITRRVGDERELID
ncbi:MAG: selenocysteine-specific translation elongation factor [Candidatus Promineifilaceae bacterium]